MNFQELLKNREILMRQARLANVAFAWQRLGEFAARFDRARLRGGAILTLPEPHGGGRGLALQPLTASSAVVEEHFTEEDLVELADVMLFVGAASESGEITFSFEDVLADHGAALLRELVAAGVPVPVAKRNVSSDGSPPAGSGGRGSVPGREH